MSLPSLVLSAPLAILITLAVLAMCGLGSANNGLPSSVVIGGGSNLYDSSGKLIFYANLTCAVVSPFGYHYVLVQGDGANKAYAFFINGTYSFNLINAIFDVKYPLFTDTHGDVPAYWSQVGGIGGAFSAGIGGSLGLVAIAVAIMALAAVIGISIVGSGENTASVMTILKITGYLAIWGVFSALALGLINSMGSFGMILFFVLSGLYVIGLVDSIGFPSGMGAGV